MPGVRMPIEIGITHVNKVWKAQNMKRKVVKDMFVIGIFQRGGKVRVEVLEDKKPASIHEMVINNVATGCLIYVEENVLPKSLFDLYEIVELKESDRKGRSSDFHVNNINTLWRDLKRCIKDVHVQVSKEHLQGYCNEVAWRRNHADLSPSDRFALLISNSALTKPAKYPKRTSS